MIYKDGGKYLDQITDDSVVRVIKQLADHYKTNISNRFIRPVLLQLPFDEILWSQIESITERHEQLDYQGYHFDDLYRQIAALTKLVDAVRREIAPTLRYRIGNNYADKMDRVLRDMTINNFSANLQIFANIIYELYSKLVELDTEASKGKRPVYKQYAELEDIKEKLLNAEP
jgi:hypothetical protein